MPHRGQILPLGARRLAAVLLLSPSALACSRSGEVVVVLDSTMQHDSVEVVAFPLVSRASTTATDDAAGGAIRTKASTAPSALDDSATMLAVRFRGMRDSLNGEAAALEHMDRRTRSYAVRYAEIRRRTLAAETLRARRDSLRTRADAQRSAAEVDSPAPNGSPGSPGAVTSIDGLQRHAARNALLVLALPPGEWSIGAARAGSMPPTPTRIMVTRGSSDTIRLGLPARPPRAMP